jgi:tetratricopeptide (TPR) repeat protein
MLVFLPFVEARRSPLGSTTRLAAAGALGLAVVVLAYANHFGNGFHFDDSHSIVDNVYIRDLGNIPRFFTDATTFSSLPQNQAYRPLLLVTYALDDRLGGGLKASQFQLTSFLFFAAQCVLMALLFARLLDLSGPAPRNRYLALFAAGLYGVHTAIAETVNYISARSDILSTLFLVLALTLYIVFPKARRWGVYLGVLLLGGLVKPVVIVFPLLVFAYVGLLESGPASDHAKRWSRAAIAALPSLAAAIAVVLLHWRMTPPGFNPGAPPRFNYLITQPYVALRYLGKFLLPSGLSADTDLGPFTGLADPRALLGLVALVAFLVVAVWTSKREPLRTVAFGLWWFVIALLPTSLFPLAEVENDHRMYLPFVGLVLAAVAAVDRTVERWAGHRRWVSRSVAAAGVTVLALLAWGTHERNRVWRDEESLWRDTTRKSPRNGRAWMNYGLTLMARGQVDAALACFQKGKQLVPAYSYLYVNFGIAFEAKGRPAEAEANFLEAIRLAQRTAEPYFYYARFLERRKRAAEALVFVRKALAESPAHIASRHLLLALLEETGDTTALRQAATETLALWPEDPAAKRALQSTVVRWGVDTDRAHPASASPEDLLAESLALYRLGRYEDSIAACRRALELRPDYADAYNNICAASNQLGKWDQAITACEQALRLKPDFELARNNLRWAQAHRRAPGR